MIKCDWTPQISMIERKINVYKIAEQRQSMYEKLVTFEGPMHLSKFGKVTLQSIFNDLTMLRKRGRLLAHLNEYRARYLTQLSMTSTWR